MITFKLKQWTFSDRWLLTILSGASLFYVLYVFKAYGIQTGLSYSGHSHLFRAAAFGLSTSLVFFLFECYVFKLVDMGTFKKKLLWVSVELFAGANIVFLLFNYFWNWREWTLSAYGLILIEYSCIMLIPVLLVWSLFRIKKQQVKLDHHGLKFTSENGKELISVNPSDLLFLQSSGNYIEIVYQSNGKVAKHLLRNSLKNIEMLYQQSPYLQRCHRSFLVNPKSIRHIVQVKGKTELDLGMVCVPVSKQYQELFVS